MRNTLDPDHTYAITDVAADWEQVHTRLILAGHHGAGLLPLDDPRLRGRSDLVAKAEQINQCARRATYEATNPEARASD